jgi:hypothetical protein
LIRWQKSYSDKKNKLILRRFVKKREDRLEDALYEKFFGQKIQDPIMDEVFVKAAEYSEEFKAAFENFNQEPKDPRAYKQRKGHLAENIAG